MEDLKITKCDEKDTTGVANLSYATNKEDNVTTNISVQTVYQIQFYNYPKELNQEYGWETLTCYEDIPSETEAKAMLKELSDIYKEANVEVALRIVKLTTTVNTKETVIESNEVLCKRASYNPKFDMLILEKCINGKPKPAESATLNFNIDGGEDE